MAERCIYPAKRLSGTLSVIGDKSITHRLILLSAIAEGQSVLHAYSTGEDCLSSLKAIQQLGVDVMRQGDALIIQGVGLHGLTPPQAPIDCANSGTTMRLLMGLLSGAGISAILLGDTSLSKRPMARVADPLRAMGARLTLSSQNTAPISIYPQQAKEAIFTAPLLSAIHYQMPVASAQVKSALLLAGLYAKGQTCLTEIAVTRDHTERLLSLFGHPCQRQGQTISMASLRSLQPIDYEIPGDISSAAFWLVAGLLVPNSRLRLKKIGINPTRTGILKILSLMGGQFVLYPSSALDSIEPVADIDVSFSRLKGIDISKEDVSLAIDEFPIIFVAAALAKGTTKIFGLEELRLKETDRIHAMVTNLRILGIQIQEFSDGVIIEGGKIQGGVVNSFGDHRIAMSMVIAGLVSQASILIQGVESIAVSYPQFFEDLSSVLN
jgi:3-phosphoshikimate 1-carboxyvinyltransferase